MDSKKFTGKQQLWHYAKRFLRAVVPQLPTVYAMSQGLTWGPYLVFVGGILTAADKLCRNQGYY